MDTKANHKHKCSKNNELICLVEFFGFYNRRSMQISRQNQRTVMALVAQTTLGVFKSGYVSNQLRYLNDSYHDERRKVDILSLFNSF